MSVIPFTSSGRQHDIPLTEIGRYPHLAEALQSWQQSDARQVDPLTLPKILLPYVMLLDLERQPTRLRIRLAGTYICEKHGGELKGRTTDEFFRPADAELVVEAALTVAKFGIPSLAERHYVGFDGKLWSYVRLIAPLSRDGNGVDSFFKVLDPTSLNEIEETACSR